LKGKRKRYVDDQEEESDFNGEEQEEEEEDGDEEDRGLDWDVIGRMAQKFSKKVPISGFMSVHSLPSLLSDIKAFQIGMDL
jgi:hypothetical protein